MQNRRTFLKTSMAAVSMGLLAGCGVTAASASASSAPASSAASSTSGTAAAAAAIEAPAFPFAYYQLDADKARARAYQGFYDLGGCARAVFDAVIGELADQYGYPYNQVPSEMYSNGHAGYTTGSLCGTLGGAAGALGLLIPTDKVDEQLKSILSWYSTTQLPIYQPEMELVTTVANSVDCKDSLGTWMTAANVAERSDPKRLARCAGLCADVAGKTIETLNVYYGFAAAEPAAESGAESYALGENQYLGTAKGMEGDVTVRVTMDGGKISQVEVLKQTETAGIGTKAVDELPAKFVGMSSAAEVDGVDAVAGATVTSTALKEAIKAALAQVK